MLSYQQSVFLYTASLKAADAATALLVWYACWYVRFHSAWFSVTKGLPEWAYYSRVSLPLVLVVSLMLHVVGAYRRDRVSFGFRAIKKVAEGAILGTLVFVATCYFLGEVNFSRVFLALFAVALTASLIVERAIADWIGHAMGMFVRRLRVLCVGQGELLDMFIAKIDRHRPYPVTWVGRLGPGEEDRLGKVLAQTTPDQVIVSYPEGNSAAYGRVLEVLSEELVDVKVLPDFGKYSTFTYTAKDEWGIPLLVFNQTPVGISDRATKRVVDVLGSTLFLVVLSPLYAAIALAIKLGSRGPVFFSQERVGSDGRRFVIYKFRTMRVDAEAETGPVWATENDARTTALGKWLRKTSLDEIPQFWNVLRGDMSLVGPRPERPEFVDQFRKEIPKYMLRHKVKSGITGWAQVNGWRGNTSLNERIKHDLYYIGHWSHRFDLKILFLTLFKGFVHRHAY